ncbi:hypothetical protein J6590_072655 [Homalodisca vitripennis]|nr:hypothetical protein J6590_072655 [Homalodisca vitripennis]
MLHSGKGDGELGIQTLEFLVARVGLGLGLRFQVSPDPAIRAMNGCASTTARLRGMANSVRINCPCTTADLRQFNSRFTITLQLRTDTACNRTTTHRYSPQPDMNCRRCRSKLETLGHILGEHGSQSDPSAQRACGPH